VEHQHIVSLIVHKTRPQSWSLFIEDRREILQMTFWRPNFLL